jgi:O-methyltransferase
MISIFKITVKKIFNWSSYVVNSMTKKSKTKTEIKFLGEQIQIFSSTEELQIIRDNLKFTLTGPARMAATMRSLKYASVNKIQGAFVECGVWKGGQIIAGAEQLRLLNDFREIFLYDTFSGMTEASEIDISFQNESAISLMETSEPKSDNVWAKVSIAEVKKNLDMVAYPEKLIRFISGDVRETLLKSENMPEKISVLRLDTDWFDSTYIELLKLYPLLSLGGVLLIDDYGHWEGSRKAADKYFHEIGVDPFWNAIDYTCVMHIKV